MAERTNGDRIPADLALIAARLGAELRDAGVPAGPGRCERFARAVPLVRPATQYELYLCALATFASGPEQVETVQRVFSDLFGGAAAQPAGPPGPPAPDWPRPAADDLLAEAARAAQEHPAPRPGPSAAGAARPAIPAPEPDQRTAWPARPRRRTRISQRPPARCWPAGPSGWRARISPS